MARSSKKGPFVDHSLEKKVLKAIETKDKKKEVQPKPKIASK